MPHINFEKLKDLQMSNIKTSIADCKIMSIEFSINLSAPSLTSLDLSIYILRRPQFYNKLQSL